MHREIYLAGGCFWGLEQYFSCVPGVLSTQVGYANAVVPNPSYELVCTGRTGAAQAVRVVYDAVMIPFDGILRLFFDVIDPVSVNRQGSDCGTQFRTGIYARNAEDLREAQRFVQAEQMRCRLPLAVEVLPLKNYFRAEEYHQKYLDTHPGGYCHIGKEAFDHARNYKVQAAR